VLEASNNISLCVPSATISNVRVMQLLLLAKCQLHNANHWCFKCQRYHKGNSIRQNKMPTEQPRLSKPNS